MYLYRVDEGMGIRWVGDEISLKLRKPAEVKEALRDWAFRGRISFKYMMKKAGIREISNADHLLAFNRTYEENRKMIRNPRFKIQVRNLENYRFPEGTEAYRIYNELEASGKLGEAIERYLEGERDLETEKIAYLVEQAGISRYVPYISPLQFPLQKHASIDIGFVSFTISKDVEHLRKLANKFGGKVYYTIKVPREYLKYFFENTALYPEEKEVTFIGSRIPKSWIIEKRSI